MKLSTYDRFFPNQDTIPAAGFGNLIALPLQKIPRANGNTVFLDGDLNPYADQWEYLASVRRVTLDELDTITESVRPTIAEKHEANGADAAALRCNEGALDLIPQTVTKGVFEGVLGIDLDAQVSIATATLPACLIASLKRLGTLPNPTFYEKQRLRFPTYNVPRFIFCGELHESRLVLPRGTLPGVLELARKAGGKAKVHDRSPFRRAGQNQGRHEGEAEVRVCRHQISPRQHRNTLASPGAPAAQCRQTVFSLCRAFR